MLLSRPRPLGFIEPCQPTNALKPPIGPGWLHEIKHDGYRLMALRTGERMRLLTRNGNDWSEFFPAVLAALKALEVRSCLIDGEVVVCDERGLEFSATVHLSFYELEFRDLTFGLTVGPRQVDCGVDGGLVLDDSVGE
jgi:ATP-dependent DNA ligase